MKTQVSILVKNESLTSRFFSFLWFINIFKKMSVEVYLDTMDNKRVLKASKEPYLIDVEPGEHELLFADPRAGSKAAFKGVTGAIFGASIAGASGGSMIGGAAMGYDDASGDSVKDNIVSCMLKEGDVLRISAKPKHNGSVKVKILKDK